MTTAFLGLVKSAWDRIEPSTITPVLAVAEVAALGLIQLVPFTPTAGECDDTYRSIAWGLFGIAFLAGVFNARSFFKEYGIKYTWAPTGPLGKLFIVLCRFLGDFFLLWSIGLAMIADKIAKDQCGEGHMSFSQKYGGLDKPAAFPILVLLALIFTALRATVIRTKMRDTTATVRVPTRGVAGAHADFEIVEICVEPAPKDMDEILRKVFLKTGAIKGRADCTDVRLVQWDASTIEPAAMTAQGAYELVLA